MARFGTGINASLGAINYTPYMQGALAGSQAIAQGIATLGQVAGKSINDYYAKKEDEKKKDEAANSFIKTVESNPAAFQAYMKDGKIDKEAVRSMVDTLGFNGTLQLNTYLSEAVKQQKAEKTKGEAVKYADFLSKTAGENNAGAPFMGELRKFQESQFSPEARMAGRQMNLETRKTEAQIGELESRANEAARIEAGKLRQVQQNGALVNIANSSSSFDTFMKSIQEAGLPAEKAPQIWKDISEAKASTSDPASVKSSVLNVDLPGGNMESFIIISKPGGSPQVFPATQSRTPADVKKAKAAEDLLLRAEQAFRKGDSAQALRLLRAGNFKNGFGDTIMESDLMSFFPSSSGKYTVEVE